LNKPDFDRWSLDNGSEATAKVCRARRITNLQQPISWDEKCGAKSEWL